MPGLVPGIHVFEHGTRRMAGTKACKSTPFFERLCPAMTVWPALAYNPGGTFLHKPEFVMAIYLLFGKYSHEAFKGISAKRTEESKALIKKHGGELKAAYATLGGVDLMMAIDLPDNR